MKEGRYISGKDTRLTSHGQHPTLKRGADRSVFIHMDDHVEKEENKQEIAFRAPKKYRRNESQMLKSPQELVDEMKRLNKQRDEYEAEQAIREVQRILGISSEGNRFEEGGDSPTPGDRRESDDFLSEEMEDVHEPPIAHDVNRDDEGEEPPRGVERTAQMPDEPEGPEVHPPITPAGTHIEQDQDVHEDEPAHEVRGSSDAPMRPENSGTDDAQDEDSLGEEVDDDSAPVEAGGGGGREGGRPTITGGEDGSGGGEPPRRGFGDTGESEDDEFEPPEDPEERLKKELDEALKREKTYDPGKELAGIIGEIERADISTLEEQVNKLKKYVSYMRFVNEDRTGAFSKRILELESKIDAAKKEGGDAALGVLRQDSLKLTEDLGQFYTSRNKEKEGRIEINSLEEYVELIMDSETDRWARGGERELISVNPETGEEEVNFANLLAWVRSQIVYYDDFSPDSEIRLFQEISTSTPYRTITLGEVINTPRYFRKRKTVIRGVYDEDSGEFQQLVNDINRNRVSGRLEQHQEKNENGDIIATKWVHYLDTYVEDPEYDKLKEQILHESWLMGENHNADANYRLVMGSDKDLPGQLMKTHYGNTFTKTRDRLLRILKLPGTSGEDSALDQLFEDARLGKSGYQEKQGTVGDLIQRFELSYYHLCDQEMFEKVLGAEGMKSFYIAIAKSLFDKGASQTEEKDQENNIIRDEKTGESIKRDLDFNNVDDRAIFAQRVLAEWGDDPTFVERARNNPDSFFKELAFKGTLYKFKDGKFAEGGEKKMKDIRLRPGEDEYLDFIDAFNIYSLVKNDEAYMSVVRNAIREGIEGKFIAPHKTEITRLKEELRRNPSNRLALEKELRDAQTTINKSNDDIKYAEMWAFRMTYWTGISARNDTMAIGADKDAVRQHTKENRLRQKSGRGPAGIEDTIWGIKKMGLNFWEGLQVRTDESRGFDKTLLEVLQGGQGSTIDIDSDIENFDFQGNAQRQFALEHIGNGFKVFGFLEKHGLNLASYFKRDEVTKEVMFDADKFEADIQDGPWHDLRYALDQPSFNYDEKIIRVWQQEEQEDGKRKLVFRDLNIRDAMFDSEVNTMFMYNSEGRGAVKGGPSENEKDKAARNVFAYLLAKEIGWHTKQSFGQERWGVEQVDLILNGLSKWGFGWEEIEKNGRKQVVMKERFFTEKELERIVALGNAKRNTLLLRQAKRDGLRGAAEGFGEGLKFFLQKTFSF